jgi:hypothetical protein
MTGKHLNYQTFLLLGAVKNLISVGSGYYLLEIKGENN